MSYISSTGLPVVGHCRYRVNNEFLTRSPEDQSNERRIMADAHPPKQERVEISQSTFCIILDGVCIYLSKLIENQRRN